MSWPIYTEQLLVVFTGGVFVSWKVPAGKRAVVKSIVACNNGATSQDAGFWIGGHPAWSAHVPALNSASSGEVIFVGYAGQDLVGITATSDVILHASGYLFDDATGSTGVFEEQVVTVPPEGWTRSTPPVVAGE